MDIISEICIFLIIMGFMVWWWQTQYDKNKIFYKNISGPPGNIIFGNALDFRSTSDILDTLMGYVKEYGELVRVKIGPLNTFIVVADYKFLEAILSSTKFLAKSDDYLYLKPWLGEGLLTSDGPKWKKHRRILTPGFHFQILELFIEVFESCGNKLIEKLEKESIKKKHIDVYPLVTLCALDIICESTMGVSINAQENENSAYVRSVKDMCRITMERALSPLQMYDWLFPLSRNYYTQRKALKVLHTQTNTVINNRRKELKNKNDDTFDEETSTKRKKVFLDLLLQATVDGRPLTHEEIREEVDTFMFEGHDTTTSAISFTLFCLANFPKVQEKAFEEQKCLFGNDKQPNVSYADLQKMKYLEQVIKETLRLYPTVPLYARRLTEDFEYGNTTLPKGDTLTIFAYGIHRNPKYFKDPETFNPDRFENYDGKYPYAYIPFSAGPRNCIGQKFAMLELKSTISKILRTFELHPTVPKHQLKLVSETILKSANGIKIMLKPRHEEK